MENLDHVPENLGQSRVKTNLYKYIYLKKSIADVKKYYLEISNTAQT